jgi:uncharacterized UBP type Zn finger protein
MKQITKTVEGVMKALSSSQQSEVKAWEEEILPCEHTLTLAQEPLISPGDGPSARIPRQDVADKQFQRSAHHAI